MIRLQHHVPPFICDGQGGWTTQAATLADLLALPEVAAFTSDVEPVERRGTVSAFVEGEWRTVDVIHPAPAERRFFRFSRSGNHLMAEHNHGDVWWVVGSLRADDPAELAELPPWVESETGRIRREAWNRGECGPPPARYRCAEHGIEGAECCLGPADWRRLQRPRVTQEG